MTLADLCAFIQHCLLHSPYSGSHPVDYPDWCEVVRQPDSCTSVAVMKANNDLPCVWGRGRLRPGKTWTSDNSHFF